MIFFLFTGLSGAGKSAIARAVGQKLGLLLIEERQVLASITKEVGYVRTRDWISRVGIEKVRQAAVERTFDLICRHQEERGLIIDGCYDPLFPSELQGQFPESRVFLIVVEAAEELRIQRTMTREGTILGEALKEAKFLDSLKSMAGMRELVDTARLRILNNDKLEPAVIKAIIYCESELGGHSRGPERYS